MTDLSDTEQHATDLKAAYADPPYLGCGSRYTEHHPDAMEWDQPERHAALVRELCDGYDCWAMSLSSPSLKTILPMCPDDCRVMAWVKPFASSGAVGRALDSWRRQRRFA